MRIQPPCFRGNIAQGKKEFEKLPLEKQVALKVAERARQNLTNHIIPQKKGNLAEYVRYDIMMDEIVKNKANEIFNNVRKALGL